MMFNVTAQVGDRQGIVYPLGELLIDAEAVEDVSEYAGAYHILEMGLHYRDYVERDILPSLPEIAGFPEPFPFYALPRKLRAQGVTGNIGEAVAAIVAEETLGLAANDIAHIRTQTPFAKRRTPDYLLRLNRQFPPQLANRPPYRQIGQLPDWWPCESKARADSAGARAGVADALCQLAAYWYTLNGTLWQDDVGFGIATCMIYEVSPRIRVHFFLPRDTSGVLDFLSSFPDYDSCIEAVREDDSTLRGLLRACS